MKSICDEKGSRGLTLVELTLAIGLSGILLVALYSMLHASAQNWRRIDRKSQLYQEARSFLSRLEQDLDRSIPLRTMPFRGEESSVSLLTLARVEPMSRVDDQESNAEKIASVQYLVEEDVATGRWVIRRLEKILSPEESAVDVGSGEKFWSGFKVIRFSYADRGLAETIWRSEWKGGKVPPMVKVHLEMETFDGKESVSFEKTTRVLSGQSGGAG